MRKFYLTGSMLVILFASIFDALAQQSTPARIAPGCVEVKGEIPRNYCLFANSLLSLYGGSACKNSQANPQQFDACYRRSIDYLRNHYSRNNGWENLYTQYSVARDPYTAISYMECHYEGNISWDNKTAMANCSAIKVDEYARDYHRDRTLSLHFAPPKRGIRKARKIEPQQKKAKKKHVFVCPSIPKGWSRYPGIDCSTRATSHDPCAPSLGNILGGGSSVIQSVPGTAPESDPNKHNYCACGTIDKTGLLTCKWVRP